MRRFTIGYIEHDPTTHKKYLGKSLEGLDGDFDIITTTDTKYPSENYNTIIDNSPNDLIILLHQDVSFGPELLENINRTIDVLKDNGLDFSSLGIVGRNYGITQYSVNWSSSKEIYRYETIDCCFIVINKKQGIRFDTETFDEYHLYVEDYCIKSQEKTGLGCYSILMDGSESKNAPINIKDKPYIMHHSVTLNKRGSCWGRYYEYKNRLNIKYKRDIKTT